VFNNGQGRPEGAYSTVDELVLPIPDTNGNYPMIGSTWGPPGARWTYKAPEPTSFYSQFVSGAQRLANGNTLVCGGWIGLTREVDSEGNALWEYFNPVAATGPVTQGDIVGTRVNGVFRAPRYAPDHPAFVGRNLVPGEPLEKHEAVLLQDGSSAPHVAKIGTTVDLSLRAGHLPGQIYLVASSATEGLIPVDHRFVRMGWDPVLEASIFGLAPEIFMGYVGLLDPGHPGSQGPQGLHGDARGPPVGSHRHWDDLQHDPGRDRRLIRSAPRPRWVTTAVQPGATSCTAVGFMAT
jgi:hypothetical protein